MSNELVLPQAIMCGYYDSLNFSSLKRSQQRTSTMFEIEYFLEDGKYTYAGGVAYPISRNFVLICPPGEERYSDLPFKTKYVKFSVKGRLADVLRTCPRYFHVSASMEALTLLDEIIALHTSENENDLLLYGKLLNYISLLTENANRWASGDLYQNEIIEKAQEFMKDNYREPIKLSDIASAVNLSPNYFHTTFSKNCGKTPRQYLEDYRISMAKKLLLTTRLTLEKIAEQCGFETQQYLATVFKAKTGFSPAQFKRQHQSTYFN